MNLILVLFAPIITQLTRIERKLDQLMADVKIAQESLDQFAADIQESADLIADELAKLVADAGNPLTDADVTNLQAAVDQLKGLEPPHPEQLPA